MCPGNTSIALYYRVAETLKGRIASCRYSPETILPPENNLAQEFNVSNITIRKAMALLVEQGLVARRRGIGTQVVDLREDRIPLKITGNFSDWVDSAINRSLRLEVEVLGISVVSCPFSIADKLGLPNKSPIWELKRLRKRNGEATSYYLNYTPPALLHGASKKDFTKESFIDIFQRKTGLRVAKISQQVEVVVADLDVGAILGVSFGAPIFFVTNTYFTPENTPLWVTQMYFRGDRYVYQGDIHLEGQKAKGG